MNDLHRCALAGLALGSVIGIPLFFFVNETAGTIALWGLFIAGVITAFIRQDRRLKRDDDWFQEAIRRADQDAATIFGHGLAGRYVRWHANETGQHQWEVIRLDNAIPTRIGVVGSAQHACQLIDSDRLLVLADPAAVEVAPPTIGGIPRV